MAPPCLPLPSAPKWRGHSIFPLGWSVCSARLKARLCRALSSSVELCRAVELSSLTLDRPSHGVRGVLSRSVEVCRVAVELSCRVACRVAVEFPVVCRVVEARAPNCCQPVISSIMQQYRQLQGTTKRSNAHVRCKNFVCELSVEVGILSTCNMIACTIMRMRVRAQTPGLRYT